MDEREKQTEDAERTERHLRLVPPPERRNASKRRDWRMWATLGIAAILLGSVALLNNRSLVPAPGGEFGQPIRFQGEGVGQGQAQPQPQVGTGELVDRVALLEAALAQGDWSLADQRADDLQQTWERVRPTLNPASDSTVWTSTDVAEFDAAVARLESWIEQRNMAQALTEISILHRTVAPFTQPDSSVPLNSTR